MTRVIIFDTETTGLSPADGHRLVEIGAVEMMAGSLTGATFHVYINPERDMPVEAYRVHKISEEFLRDKPLFSDPSIGQAFLDFVEGADLVAHNAPFDVGFINAELERAELPRLNNKIIDTVPMARKAFPGSPASLDALCQRFGISKAEREEKGHGALLDSELLARVYVELTGGRQGGLALDPLVKTDDGPPVSASDTSYRRPKPLRSLLTEQEKAAHRAFVEELGEPLWLKVLQPEGSA
ncbi:MAG: DNA polymerase III subunit epsilon [Pseudomonadota bacterium]